MLRHGRARLCGTETRVADGDEGLLPTIGTSCPVSQRGGARPRDRPDPARPWRRPGATSRDSVLPLVPAADSRDPGRSRGLSIVMAQPSRYLVKWNSASWVEPSTSRKESFAQLPAQLLSVCQV